MDAYRDPEVERRIAAQRIFSSATAEIGWLTLPVDDPKFVRSGVPGRHLLVFPRSSVAIVHDDGPTVIGNRNTVTFYCPEDSYRRRALDREGDCCAWFALDSRLLAEVVDACQPPSHRIPGRLLVPRWAPAPARAFLRERRLVAALRSGRAVDPLAVEETVIALFRQQLVAAFAASGARKPCGGSLMPVHRRLSRRTRELLSVRFADDLRLADIAREIGTSQYHLCRIFRRAEGVSIHRYRTRLRLRAALDLAQSHGWRWSDIAAEVGFSSHAHLTSCFRREFGRVPSRAL